MKKWLTIAIVLVGCNPRVISYLNPKADYKNFETYRLVSAKLDSKNVTPENTMIFDLIKENINDEMEKRNYKKSNISPDLTLRYEITSSTRVEVPNAVQSPYFFSPTQFNSRTIYESFLLLELYNENQKLVWQGSYDLRQVRKEKKASRAIEKAVGYIFTTYPYNALSAKPDETLKSINKN